MKKLHKKLKQTKRSAR